MELDAKGTIRPGRAGRQGNLCRSVRRIAIDPTGDGGKGDRGTGVLLRQSQAVGIGRMQQRGRIAILMIARADGVNHIAAFQLAGRGDSRFARRTAYPPRGGDLFALFEQLRAGRPVNRTIHPATAQHLRIGRIDNRIRVGLGDIALDDPYFRPFVARQPGPHCL